MTFRKILLNKCQKEFESESTSEKQIEADKEIHFDSVSSSLFICLLIMKLLELISDLRNSWEMCMIEV